MDLEERAQTVKLLDENLWGYICDIEEGKIFLET